MGRDLLPRAGGPGEMVNMIFTLEGCRSGPQGQAEALTLGGVEGVTPPL